MADPFKTFAPEDIEYQNKTSTPAYKTVAFSGSAAAPSYVAKLEEINQRAPWLSPETQLSLAKGNASQETIDLAGQYAAQRQVDTYDERVQQAGTLTAPVRWAYNGVAWAGKLASSIYKSVVPGPARAGAGFLSENLSAAASDVLGQAKPVTRWGVAALDIIPETIQNTASVIMGQSNYDVGGLWASTSIGTLLDNRAAGGTAGEGYFMSDRLRQEQARRARVFRGTINGSAFTVGRGIASTLQLEGTSAYNYASGIIDAMITIAAPDPTKGVVKGGKAVAGGIGAVRSGLAFKAGLKTSGGIRGIVPMLSNIDAKGLRKSLQEFADNAHGEAGLAASITGGNVNQERFVNFFRRNPTARKMVEVLRDETKPSVIQDEIFQYGISNDLAMRIATAKTDEEVISAMTYGWTFGDEALSANIGKYKVTRTPMMTGLRKSKYFTKLPRGSVIVDGDEAQSAEAVKSIVNTMRSSGVPEDMVRGWLDGANGKKGAVSSFTQTGGSAVDRKNSLDSFNEAMALTLKANGVTEPIIKEVLYQANDHIDRIRNYWVTVHGRRTDNGHLAMQLEHYKNNLPPDVYNTWLEGVGENFTDLEFAQPMEIVDMLNRTQVLPDVRKLRRLTRNRLLAKALADEKGQARFGKLAITAKKEVRQLTKITDEVAWQDADDELQDLIRLEGPARINANDRIDQLEDIKEKLTIKYEDSVNTGKQRLALQMIETLQNDIWKPLNLATFGYILRNGMDAQARMAFGGISSPSHPIDYINLLLGRKYNKDIRGVEIASLGVSSVDDLEDVAVGSAGYAQRAIANRGVNPDRVHEELREAFVTNANRVGWTASDSYMHGVNTGSFPVVSRNSGPSSYPTQYHTDGIVQQGQKTIADPLQSIAAKGLSAGKTDEAIIDDVMEYLQDPYNLASRNLQRLYYDGINYWQDGKLLKSIPEDLAKLRKTNPDAFNSLMRGHLRTIVLPNVKKNTGGLDEVTFLYAHDRVPNMKAISNHPVEDFELPTNQKELKIGDLQTITTEGGKVEGIINNISVAPDGSKIATFVPVEPGLALSKGARRGATGQRNARRIIERSKLYDPADGKGLPTDVVREQRAWSTTDKPNLDAMNIRAVNFFFNQLNDVLVRKLEKSPTFRTFYYQTVGTHIDELSYEEGVKLYDDILSKAKEEGKSIRQYLGEARFNKNGVGNKIEALPNRTNVKGTLTVEELDDYGRFKGLADTKELLYDASNRNNFGDAMRVIAPFAGAWGDVMGTWTSFLLKDNVHTARTFQRVYTGLSNADPDQDGRGIFYKDPQDGKLMFTFPLSGSLTKLFTGINAPLVAPIGRLSGGIGVFPALGPWGQFAASNLIPDTPDYDKFRQLLVPYGDKTLTQTLTSVVPGYVSKTLGALPLVGQNTENLTNVYGQTYIETLRALSTNPNYDLNNPDDVIQLKADAKSRASILTIMRAVSQFTGPTAGTLETKVETRVGDVYVSELIKQLQTFQEDDYDTAVPKFLKLFGDELMLYATSKTKATTKGLETSVEFDAWTRNNKDLMDQYPDVANYFAPKGSDFEFSVWSRQTRNGQRVALTDDELIATAQNRLGAVKYRAARQMFGAFPSEDQLAKLKDYRIYLNQQLPGFPVNVEFTVNQVDNDIISLKEMVKDPRLANNPITSSVAQYLAARDIALQQVGGKSLKSKKASPLRAQLYQFGEDLAFRNPEFGRLWERLLLQEVEE
jgi:hypothetical protein